MGKDIFGTARLCSNFYSPFGFHDVTRNNLFRVRKENSSPLVIFRLYEICRIELVPKYLKYS